MELKRFAETFHSGCLPIKAADNTVKDLLMTLFSLQLCLLMYWTWKSTKDPNTKENMYNLLNTQRNIFSIPTDVN